MSPGLSVLAGPATKGEETLLMQSDLITRAAGMTNEQVAKSLDFDRESYNLVRQREGSRDPGKQARGSGQGERSGARHAFCVSPAADSLDKLAVVSLFPRLRSRARASKDEVPRLRLERRERSAGAAERKFAAAPKGARRPAATRIFRSSNWPSLNHQFQHCYMGLPAESRAIEETFAPEALTTISSWILKHSSP